MKGLQSNSSRRRDVLHLKSRGLSHPEIAIMLGINRDQHSRRANKRARNRSATFTSLQRNAQHDRQTVEAA